MARASSNPAFNNSPAFSMDSRKAVQFARPVSSTELDDMYGRPSASPDAQGRMTYEDTYVKIAISFGILLVGAAVGWVIPLLAFPAAIVGLVLALVNIFKKQPSRGLILAYAAVEGVFVGGISALFEVKYPGIAVQAVIGTLIVVGVTLALFASGKIRASKRATQVFLVAMVSYAGFSIVNLVLMLTGATDGNFGLRSQESFIPGVPWGALIGIFVILLAAYSLVLDFTTVKTGVERGAPRVYGWQAAFGIMVTVVWLYVEILRLIAIFRD
ncbi:MAG: Bax inhibitor-1/YccA family membrane protein [Microbacteriaceae bacterium]